MPDLTADSPSRQETACILLTTAPPDIAQGLARSLVEERLAACVNLLPGVRSVYRWEGAVQDDPETLLLVKSTRRALPDLQARLTALHPYEVPEQIVLEPAALGDLYRTWLLGAVADPSKNDTNPS